MTKNLISNPLLAYPLIEWKTCGRATTFPVTAVVISVTELRGAESARRRTHWSHFRTGKTTWGSVIAAHVLIRILVMTEKLARFRIDAVTTDEGEAEGDDEENETYNFHFEKYKR